MATTQSDKVRFTGKILMVGFGAVASCTLPMLVDHIDVPLENITILDMKEKPQVKRWIPKGCSFVHLRVTQDNFDEVMSRYVGSGDMIIDLAYEIDTIKFITWCHQNNVLYVNASIEEWLPYGKTSTYESTLYFRHMNIRKAMDGWTEKGTTAVLDFGANPGLISHFVKQGLIDIAERVIQDKAATEEECCELRRLIDKRQFPELSMKLGVKVIHCAERDTQITNNPKEVNEFVNTWSVEGFHEEGMAPAEMGWGTHENHIPNHAIVPPEGPKNQIFLQHSGMNTWVHSFVPDNHEIIGMVIRHGEAFSISERLTVRDRQGRPIYRPTVHYAYLPCDGAIASLQELRGRNYDLQPQHRILEEREITSGEDILGALLMGHKYKSWWTGSDLSIQQSRLLVPGNNATVIQVAAGVIAAVSWMIQNPKEGVCLPDDLPHDYVLRIAKPYLGTWISSPYDWTPLDHKKTLFPASHHIHPPADATDGSVSNSKERDPWQFESFRFYL